MMLKNIRGTLKALPGRVAVLLGAAGVLCVPVAAEARAANDVTALQARVEAARVLLHGRADATQIDFLERLLRLSVWGNFRNW